MRSTISTGQFSKSVVLKSHKKIFLVINVSLEECLMVHKAVVNQKSQRLCTFGRFNVDV